MALDQNTINQLYTKNYKPCVGYVLSHSGNKADADDNYQDTWITFLAALEEGKEIDNVNGFLWGINKHLWNNHLRKKTKGDFD